MLGECSLSPVGSLYTAYNLIVMFANSTKKILEVVKKVRLNIIYKCINTVYIIINIFRVFIILTAIVVAASVIDPFISIQEDILLSDQYR